MRLAHVALTLAFISMASMAPLLACDDDNAVKDGALAVPPAGTAPPKVDGSVDPDGSVAPDGAPLDCFPNPKTHEEIINRCTDSVRIMKNPVLPKLLPDGGLPPL